jgi:hypothetical protein
MLVIYAGSLIEALKVRAGTQVDVVASVVFKIVCELPAVGTPLGNAGRVNDLEKRLALLEFGFLELPSTQ